MNELIILKETFKKSNEKLRQHPAFLMTLKDIELSITTLKNSTEFIETNFSVKVEKNKTSIYVCTSCFGSKPYTIYNNNRLCYINELFLNNQGDLVYVESTGEFIPNFIKEHQVSTTQFYSYNQMIYKAGTTKILKLLSMYPSNRLKNKSCILKLDNMPFQYNKLETKAIYKKYDNKIIRRLYSNMPIISKNRIEINSTIFNNYVVWVIYRNHNDLFKVNIQEWINIFIENTNKKIITKNFKNIAIKDDDFSQIIKDNLYGPKTYTKEEIESLKKDNPYINKEIQ